MPTTYESKSCYLDKSLKIQPKLKTKTLITDIKSLIDKSIDPEVYSMSTIPILPKDEVCIPISEISILPEVEESRPISLKFTESESRLIKGTYTFDE